MIQKYYVYGIVCPKSKKIKYVGKTDDVQKRFKDHLSKPTNPLLKRWFENLLKEDLKPSVITLETCSREEINEREKYFITELSKETELFNIISNPKNKAEELQKQIRVLKTENMNLRTHFNKLVGIDILKDLQKQSLEFVKILTLCDQLLREGGKKRKKQTKDEEVYDLLQLTKQLRTQLHEHQKLLGELKTRPTFHHNNTPKPLSKELIKNSASP